MLGEMCKRFVRDMGEIDREGDKARRTKEISGGGRGRVSAGEGIFWRFALD